MPSVAPLVAAWRRRLANVAGPARASGEASNGEPVTVELFVGGEWVDLTADGYVMVRDDSGQIRITYGIQGGEGSQTDRATASLQLRNTDGRFSPRNPSGPYFGLIGRNTPLRISVPDGNGGKSYRLWGEVAEWAPNWDPSGNDVWVDVTVHGIMQRLAQAPAPERSVIYQTWLDTSISDFDYYGDITTSTAATGGSLFGGLTGRYVDSSNTYYARLEFDVSNVVTLTLRRFIAGVEGNLGTYAVPITYAPGTFVRVRYQARGTSLKVKAWLATASEPPEWHISVTDGAISNTVFFGTRSVASSASTAVNPQVQYANLRVATPQSLTVTRSINGVSKTHSAGADVRLATPTYLAL
ncbi:hypothetical protein SGLAM104S_01641 [Streptomyces glaucescens]